MKIPMINLGIGGQTSRQVLERFRNDLEVSRPAYILIQVGINDLKGIGLREDDAITRNCTRNILEILKTCEAEEIHAIYSAIFPPGDIVLIRRFFWDASVSDSLQMVNSEIRQYCHEKGFTYFDTYELLESRVNPGTCAKEYQSDFLHINAGGYQLIGQALEDLLRQSDDARARQLLK
jgi:lysophospholipase L1-like esterase